MAKNKYSPIYILQPKMDVWNGNINDNNNNNNNNNNIIYCNFAFTRWQWLFY